MVGGRPIESGIDISKLQLSLGKSLSEIRDDLHAHLITVAPTCQTLCLAIQHNLPLELRNMIYAYISPPTSESIFFDGLPFDAEEEALLDDPCFLRKVAHLMDLVYCNEETRNEFV